MTRGWDAHHFATSEAPNNTAIPVIKSIFSFSAEALGELKTWLEQNPPAIPVNQIIGFTGFTANSATRITTSETTASTSYTDLATVGPTLSGLSPGSYIIGFGCVAATAAGSTGVPRMSLSVNGSTPSDNFAAQGAKTTDTISVSTWLPQTVSTANTTVQAKYKTTSGTATATFALRWLIAIKFANS